MIIYLTTFSTGSHKEFVSLVTNWFLSAFAEDLDISPWMNVQGKPSEARRANVGASADCAEEMKDTTGVSPWRLLNRPWSLLPYGEPPPSENLQYLGKN